MINSFAVGKFSLAHAIVCFGYDFFQANRLVTDIQVLGRAYRGLSRGFLLLPNFSVAIAVSPYGPHCILYF